MTKKTMNVHPLGDHVVVQLVKEEEVTFAGGKLALSKQSGMLRKGVVVAVGPGFRLQGTEIYTDMDFQVGDWVLYRYYDGEAVKINGEEYLILKEEDCTAVIR